MISASFLYLPFYIPISNQKYEVEISVTTKNLPRLDMNHLRDDTVEFNSFILAQQGSHTHDMERGNRERESYTRPGEEEGKVDIFFGRM